MDPVGLIDRINYAANLIINGRIARRTPGQTEKGLEDFELGLDLAIHVFDEALVSADPSFMLLAEYTFVIQELESGYPEEKEALASYRAARSDFDDAFRSLEVVKDAALYMGAEKTYPHRGDYRYNGYPKDAFHAAYIGHKTRLQNTLKQIGIDPQERKFREKRIQACPAAQTAYAALQKKALYNTAN
ncbi:MAG: hypothetical protein Pg6A_11320 [Termitinemataceae bacterium]|nr:MAG: hypothetical protein Pg6A_11320 [Termitinemataceae bacterium]